MKTGAFYLIYYIDICIYIIYTYIYILYSMSVIWYIINIIYFIVDPKKLNSTFMLFELVTLHHSAHCIEFSYKDGCSIMRKRGGTRGGPNNKWFFLLHTHTHAH